MFVELVYYLVKKRSHAAFERKLRFARVSEEAPDVHKLNLHVTWAEECGLGHPLHFLVHGGALPDCRHWLEISREPGDRVSYDQMDKEPNLRSVRACDWFHDLPAKGCRQVPGSAESWHGR
jgi:hypothetical protein